VKSPVVVNVNMISSVVCVVRRTRAVELSRARDDRVAHKRVVGALALVGEWNLTVVGTVGVRKDVPARVLGQTLSELDSSVNEKIEPFFVRLRKNSKKRGEGQIEICMCCWKQEKKRHRVPRRYKPW
jgi:hypothetical protein